MTPAENQPVSRVDEILMGMPQKKEVLPTTEKDVKPEPVEGTEAPPKLTRRKSRTGDSLIRVEPSIEVTPSSAKSEEFKVAIPDKKKPEDKPTDPPPLAATNEYGIPEVKTEGKMYAEEEVQRMIRERVERVRREATPDQIKEVAKDFKADPDSDEPWQAQLEDFVGKTIEKREAKVRQREMQHEEQKTQSEFETRFNRGMTKFTNYWDTVNTVPITPSVMLAVRNMENPAEFLYAAAKLQPTELERISKMKDMGAQFLEIGRLEERMKRSTKTTGAPNPIGRIASDHVEEEPKAKEEPSVDQRILDYAIQKNSRRR
jgi:hypothetical protein